MSTSRTVSHLLERPENPLAAHYGQFQVQSRILLTGHSHQAWPDCAKEGVLEAYQDATLHVDDKWGQAMAKAARVQQGYATMLDDPKGEYVLGQNVHELGLRVLSSLPAYQDPARLKSPAPLLSTHGEFHSMRRQIDRLAEYGIQTQRVPHDRNVVSALIEQLESKPSGHFGAIFVSSVGFMHGLWVPDLDRLAKAARSFNTPLIIDAYHSVNVVPLSVQALGLDDAFILGGGYKYCQLGEGVCFLRIPPQLQARPALTGWFAEFELRDQQDINDPRVKYAGGAAAFAGSTYDPVSHYRAARVLDFFQEQNLDVPTLREISQTQISRLRQSFESLGLSKDKIRLADEVPDEHRAGFLALHTPAAAQLCTQLRTHQVWADSRAEVLRLGPAPYLSLSQLDAAIETLQACCKQI